MHAALIVLANILTSSTPTATPVPTQLVLDGCNTPTAIRVAEIRMLPSDAPNLGELLGEVLAQKDGTVCLLESQVLVKLDKAGKHQRLVVRALADGLSSERHHIVTRAAELAAEIRVFDPARYDDIMRSVDAKTGKHGAWNAFGTGPAPRVPGGDVATNLSASAR